MEERHRIFASAYSNANLPLGWNEIILLNRLPDHILYPSYEMTFTEPGRRYDHFFATDAAPHIYPISSELHSLFIIDPILQIYLISTSNYLPLLFLFIIDPILHIYLISTSNYLPLLFLFIIDPILHIYLISTSN